MFFKSLSFESFSRNTAFHRWCPGIFNVSVAMNTQLDPLHCSKQTFFLHLQILHVFLSKCENICSWRRASLSSFGADDLALMIVLYYANIFQDERLQTMTTIVWVRLVSSHDDHIAFKLKRIPQYSSGRVYSFEMLTHSSFIKKHRHWI